MPCPFMESKNCSVHECDPSGLQGGCCHPPPNGTVEKVFLGVQGVHSEGSPGRGFTLPSGQGQSPFNASVLATERGGSADKQIVDQIDDINNVDQTIAVGIA